MNFTPKLVWEGGEASFKSVTLQGEKVSSNGITIGYVTGGKFSFSDVINYSSDMLAADLFATATAGFFELCSTIKIFGFKSRK